MRWWWRECFRFRPSDFARPTRALSQAPSYLAEATGTTGTLARRAGAVFGFALLFHEPRARPSRRTSRRVRRLRRLRARIRGSATRLLRPIRAPAPWPGVRGDRHRRGRAQQDRARPRPGFARVRRGEAARPAGRDRGGPRALLDHWIVC